MSFYDRWGDDSGSDSDHGYESEERPEFWYDDPDVSDGQIFCSGADPAADSEYWDYRIISACEEHDTTRVKRYISEGRELDPELRHHERPIEIAFRNVHVDEDMEIVDLLIKKGHVSPSGLLEFAIQHNRLDLVERILPYYDDEDYWINHNGCVLDLACKYGNIDIVNTILAHPNFKYCEIEGIEKDDTETERSTLIQCVYDGQVEMIDSLVVNGANYHRTLNNGSNALHIAAEKGFIEIIKKFYGYGLDINAKNNKGETPLMIARRKGHNDIVNFLIENGATEF